MLWLIAAGSVALLGVAIYLWWWVPKWQMRSVMEENPKARADIEDNFRKTVGQGLAGLLVLFGAGLGAGIAYYGTFQTLQANEEQVRRSQQAARDLLISNQVSKGFEQFGSDNVRVRLGGIYALGGVMNTSEQYYRPVLEALCTFVRDGTRTATGQGPPASEIQAALTVIASRKATETDVPDLATAHVPKAELSGAHLSAADLKAANLSDANLSGADLSSAKLNLANLSGANLSAANLVNALLFRANLSRADLAVANLGRAYLGGADLSGANLSDANLNHAGLAMANLRGANLVQANLSGAVLNNANLREAGISQAQLDQACGTDVKLNPGLTIKPC
jgi:uncharacterized protein YjbI with pentapeptide repeats